jgi:hypothetical protein
MLHRGADKALEYWRRDGVWRFLRFGARAKGGNALCLDYATEKHFCKMFMQGGKVLVFVSWPVTL